MQVDASIQHERAVNLISTQVRDRGHRLCVFDPRWKAAAVRAGAHTTFGTVVCIEFCVGYEDESDAITSRQKNGPPPRVARTNVSTQWDIGTCRGCAKIIRGSAVVEVRNCAEITPSLHASNAIWSRPRRRRGPPDDFYTGTEARQIS